MDYLSKIENIIRILESNNEFQAVEKLKFLRVSAFTSSEILMSITYELILLINQNRKARELILTEVKDLKYYCASIGLHISTEISESI